MTYYSHAITPRLKHFQLPPWLTPIDPKPTPQKSLEVLMQTDPLLQKILECRDDSIFSDRLIVRYLKQS